MIILEKKTNLFLLLIITSFYSYFYLQALMKTANPNPNGVATYLLQYTIALACFPIFQTDRQEFDLKSIVKRYKILLLSILRLFYASALFLLPAGLMYLFQLLGVLKDVGEGATIASYMLFVLAIWFGFLHSTPLDQYRLLAGNAPNIIRVPFRYFKGLGYAFGNALLVRLFIGVPIYIFDYFFSRLLESFYELFILFWIETFAYFVMHFLIIILIVDRMADDESLVT